MPFRRIVVALDGSPTSLAALEATAELASAWGAEITGLFLEDTSLLRMASLPFAQEVGSHSGAFRALNVGQAERELRSQADRARNTLWYVAERFRLTASFNVARGTVQKELLKALNESDMLSMGKGGGSVAGGVGLGTNAKAVAASGTGVAMLHSHVARVSGPPAVIYDGSPSAVRALEIGGEFASTLGTSLLVLCPVEGECREELQEKASATIRDPRTKLEFRPLVTRSPQDIARNVRSSGANIVVVPTKGPVLTKETVETLLFRFFGPVILVGESQTEEGDGEA